MGLFSFLKGSGAKLFNKHEEETIKTVSPDVALNMKKDAMLKAVNDLNLPVQNLSLDINDETVTVWGQAETQMAKELTVLTLGNNVGISSVDDRMSVIATDPEPEAVFYEVKSGDTLSKIAKAQYGNASKYNAIFEANKPMLKDPDKIYPGQVLRIPQL
ncbi:MAG: peptidoglycan-binding protein LysM [Saprospiraceae bacterium]|uniref:Potassium binding protein Kbp n=1 Tax=Candidatus Opimibacter skivensis TaxID=2982028 RepID=A0A9D7SS70_9BACT|nr:peptidoglycan-binding protein LysM [Candidatus Opimibacter skivensis]